ncbi:GGDEF domain-containing protein [Aquabacterium humicola]|uniref:GGDEF domain-containing protein n=1 Tax=Aquabacterium humicola TaxID=3237377 RepID=UPI002543CAF8|nr:tetratricopeptide repeat-containing diguanylate cyclase [Rubrivivax pictus]
MKLLATMLRAGTACALLVLATAGTAAPSPSPSSAPAPDGRLAALEDSSRAQPREAIARLGALAPTLPDASAQRVLALALRGQLQAQRDDAEGAELALRELEQLRGREPSAAAAAGYVRATLTQRRGPMARADRQAADALALLPAGAMPSLRYRLMHLLASVKEETGQLDEAVRLRQQLIQLADQAGPAWRQSEARMALAYTLRLAKQDQAAREMNRDALARARAAGDKLAESRALNIEGMLLADAGDAAGELRAMQRMMELARETGAREDEVLGLANLADHYLKGGDYATALRLSREALPLARELSDPASESVALANIGLALISMRQRDEGLEYARRSMAIDERAGAVTSLAQTQEELGIYLERAGYLADAVEAYRRFRKLSDEVFRRDQQQAILELQEGFDNERRQRELDLLQRENSLKQAQLTGAQLQQRVWIAAAAIGVLVLALAAVLLLKLRRAGHLLVEGNALLQTQSERDPLTNLANRRYLQRVMQPEADGAQPFEGSLLLIDLDHFKRINDRHGHAAGDAVLIEVARRLRATLRDEDLVVRWGGEEFLVVAQALTQDQVQALAQRLLTAIGGTPVALPGSGAPPVAISASIGYACFPTEPTRLAVNWEHALDLVDTALYLAKAHGRNLAYGVRLLHARDETELVQISRGLEAAWTDGRVKLTPLRGPSQAGATAAQEPVA